MGIKVTVLVDNNDGESLKGEWGLSFYIRYGDETVLLDSGLSDLFAENAEKLEMNDHAMLYVAHDCEENCYDRGKILSRIATGS